MDCSREDGLRLVLLVQYRKSLALIRPLRKPLEPVPQCEPSLSLLSLDANQLRTKEAAVASVLGTLEPNDSNRSTSRILLVTCRPAQSTNSSQRPQVPR